MTPNSTQTEKLLFEASHPPLRIILESMGAQTKLMRKDPQSWEEMYLFGRPDLADRPSRVQGTYLCLPPGVDVPELRAGVASVKLLRAVYSGQLAEGSQLSDLRATGKPYIKPTRTDGLLWNEIPSRRPGDPGGRVAELSRDAFGTRITSLMDCRPGWILDEHDHSSDVLTFCIRGGGLLGIEERSEPYLAGQLVAIAAGTRHSFQTGADGALLIVFVYEPFIV